MTMQKEDIIEGVSELVGEFDNANDRDMMPRELDLEWAETVTLSQRITVIVPRWWTPKQVENWVQSGGRWAEHTSAEGDCKTVEFAMVLSVEAVEPE